ncbi:PEP-CTERM sorting domain-containing protein [Leptolyngbya boryana CZ1]|jgi:hypothetical protein|uniref:Ice-binding protein C-terminal domain-containing protein n=2 Tax=Leptolyngbya boryana TaxID=1184 RepID=A0A1Z4JDW3_LEPBY|nr:MULTISPECIES: PEP-CTERM sorting domain-containing protein [Leptolyngbya]BAY54949.1 hypothetical protein NIES2135_17690 [Leptolyngbya boryana NIES-2135]MBD2365928.1 PEP-CTERM sorting domain-containing protein [Leptolyngbya sp. FACHB-161]MBD2372108.1 PEP-CTERM sorting domain-containing protein [Leptolyngbya sp. FACHB-238]MBD2396532.1 PEP-CTERM sorting domain-containing protein [Leptolyngbya sp. FACHB-239]MBD2403054.1 PEP-CTERM sorting domain-containing protein [Leptolyngbya sp. FACHB-402]
MNKQVSLSLFAGVLATGAIVAFQPSANAASFSFSASDAVNAGCVGQTNCNVNGFFSVGASTTRNAFDPVLTQKTVGGVLGIGIDSSKDANGNPAGETVNNQSLGEIDIDETLSVGFKSAGVLKALDLSFLYRPGVYNDGVFEVALVQADGGIGSGTLRVTSANSAVWSLGGTVTNLALSSKDAGGSYRITNPFGDIKITGFSLKALAQTAPNSTTTPAGAKNSDFTLSRVEVTKVPEPTTVIGLGLVGLLAASRRRKAAKAN